MVTLCFIFQTTSIICKVFPCLSSKYLCENLFHNFFLFQSADHLTFSYKFGSFLKIEEFVEFRERLNNSLHYALVTVERMLFELVITKSFLDTVKVSV
jgi:hypothetical protein